MRERPIVKDPKDCTDKELERIWQASAFAIECFVKVYWKTNSEEDKQRVFEAQERQAQIQKEITRRH